MEKFLIAAVSKNNFIGKEGKLPWHSKEETEHFKKTTTGFPVIMGRKSWEGLDKPLGKRVNIVITRNKSFQTNFNQAIFFHSLDDAFNYCRQSNFEKVFIIGGGDIFNQTINIADGIILSRMNFETDGDVSFPVINDEVWKEISSQKFTDFTVHYYIRK